MTMANVLAVDKTSPMVLVVESAEGTVLERSLTDLHRAGHRLSDDACTSLIEDYQMCTCQPVAGSRGVDHRAREPDEPTTDKGSIAHVDVRDTIGTSGIRHAMTYRCQSSRTSSWVTAPHDLRHMVVLSTADEQEVHYDADHLDLRGS